MMEMVAGGGSMSDPLLWVVCPSYNDVTSFSLLRSRILEIVTASKSLDTFHVRLVIVDDTGGFDEEICGLAPLQDVRVVTPPFNLGHQRALVYGLRMILSDVKDADLIVTLDSDGEDRPEDLPRLLEPLLSSSDTGKTLSVARRTKRSESLRFKVLYMLFRVMFRTLTGTTVRSGNFAAYKGWLAKRMLLHPYFDLCYSSTLISLGISTTFVPCARGKRYAGRSRMSTLRLLMHGVRMLMPFTDRIAVRALTAFSMVFGLGIFFACVVVGIRIFTSAAIPGWTTFTLLGILILSVVVLGNFVVLFAVFSHSRGISLANLEESSGERNG
jgi:glycosyltransferase involved in cell wall biosynthesis